MSKLIRASRLTVVFIVLIAVFFIVGYATSQVASAADSEEWVGKVTGMADGDLKLFITPTGGERDGSVGGELTVDLNFTGAYGSATAICSIKGKITNGILKGIISGSVLLDVGSTGIDGELIGTTISETQMSGTWSVTHIAGSHSGEWTAEKVR
jgi:hypothetical protein